MIDEIGFYNSLKATFMIKRYLYSLFLKIQFVETLNQNQKHRLKFPDYIDVYLYGTNTPTLSI